MKYFSRFNLPGLVLILAFLVAGNSKVNAEEFTSAEITARTMNLDCVEYCVVGLCFYLYCTPFGCEIDTTPRISHYLPDLFVTVYDEPMENPWTDYRQVMGGTEESVEKGLVDELVGSGLSGGEFTPAEPQPNASIKYKDVSVVGHPLALITQERISDYICESEATPWLPYFSSTFDAYAWRYGIPDRFTLAAITPGMREIGARRLSNPLGNSWGAVYPRFGKLLQHNDAKAAAVMAQRAVDIVTRTQQPHVYLPLSGSSQYSFSPSAGTGSSDPDVELDEDFTLIESQGDSSGDTGNDPDDPMSGENANQGASNERTDHWQMFSPKLDDKCRPFGSLSSTWQVGRTDEAHQYAWDYWRKYECCVPGKGVYIEHIYFPEPICSSQD